MMQQTSSRQAYLDWLRILAILGVLFFHSAMPYVTEWGWHIKNKETSNLLLEFNFWLSRFRMPLLFFISGTVTYFMLLRRSAGAFVRLRLRRLLVPLLVGIFLIVPPQIYMERLTQGYRGNLIDLYKSVYQFVAYPKGNTSWHHLWFIAYLFVYDLVLAPVFKWCMNNQDKLRFFTTLAKRKFVYLLMLPSLVLYAALAGKYPETNDLFHDGCYFFYWLLFLLVGFICISYPALLDSLEKNRRTSFTFALLTILCINYFRWNSLEPQGLFANGENVILSFCYRGLYAATAWFWVFTAVGYGKRYLDRPKKALTYINEAVYPFYILHQTVIVVLVYYIVQTSDTILLKYLFTVAAAFFVTMGIYHTLIRTSNPIRFLFGMKPKKKIAKTVEQKNLKTESHLLEVPVV